MGFLAKLASRSGGGRTVARDLRERVLVDACSDVTGFGSAHPFGGVLRSVSQHIYWSGLDAGAAARELRVLSAVFARAAGGLERAASFRDGDGLPGNGGAR